MIQDDKWSMNSDDTVLPELKENDTVESENKVNIRAPKNDKQRKNKTSKKKRSRKKARVISEDNNEEELVMSNLHSA